MKRQDGARMPKRGPAGPGARGGAGGGRVEPPSAADVAKKYGLPLDLARLVLGGALTPSEAIERLARRDQVEVLMKQHSLDRALATQIALGQARLEDVLSRRRVQEHLEQHRDHEIFHDAQKSGQPLTLALHGHRTARVVITEVRPYEVEVLEEGQPLRETIHKTRVKYAYAPDDYKKLKKNLEYDKTRRDREIEPRLRPQDRFACSNRRLGALLDAQRDVRLTTVEGEVFHGKLVRVSRYELVLHMRSGADVTILRHALDDLQEG